MYFFTLDSSDRFVQAISVLNRLTHYAILSVSPDMVSISAHHHSLQCLVSFQMMPPFFTRFFSSLTHQNQISVRTLNYLLSKMQESRFSSLAGFVADPPSFLELHFQNPSSKDQDDDSSLDRSLVLENAHVEPLSQIDMAAFFSIHSQEFNRVITMFEGSECIFVSLTNSQVKFSLESKAITFTKKDRKCIIGGTIEEEVNFLICINPLHLYKDITVESKRVWFFKNALSCAAMIAPTGLFDEYTVHFPYFC